jgi:hypothetical protein
MMTTMASPARFTPTAAPMKLTEAMLRWAGMPVAVVGAGATRVAAVAVIVNQNPHSINNQS